MTTGSFETGDGCRIAYRLDGPARAPVLLLSNSLGTAMAMWDAQMPAFARCFRVLRYDSRGHGASEAPTGAYSLDRLGRDVIELLDSLDISKVKFIGLSKGGMVGQWLGWRAPERLDQLILANTSAFMGPPEGWDTRIRAVAAEGMAAIVDPVIQRWFRPGFIASASEAIAPVRKMLLATQPGGYAGCCAAIRDMDNRVSIGLIRTPTLIIAGSEDPATPLDHAQLLADRIPGAHIEVLEAAHLSNIEQPDHFSVAVLDFCNRYD